MQKVPGGILSDLVERRRPEIMQLSGEALQDEEDFIRHQGYRGSSRLDGGHRK